MCKRPEEHPQTKALVDKVLHMFEEHGIRDFMLAFSDPDSFTEVIHVGGSRFWRVGVAGEIKTAAECDLQQERADYIGFVEGC